jgi:hypothetical protein
VAMCRNVKLCHVAIFMDVKLCHVAICRDVKLALCFTFLKIVTWLVETCKCLLHMQTNFNLLMCICWYHCYIY